jgi:hypothetical protein
MSVTIDGTVGISAPTYSVTNISYAGTLTGGTGVANLGSGQLYKDAAGNIGIGTASPSKILHIAANTGNSIYLEDNSNANASPTVRIRGWRGDLNGSQSFSGGLVLERRCDTAVGAASALGTIYFGGNYNTTPNFGYAASISAFSEGAFTSSTNTPTALVFHTGITPILDTNNANVTFGTERMRIDSSGRVTMPYQPRFMAFRTGNLTGYAGGTAAIFNNATINVGNNYNTTSGLFTAPVAGNYIFQVGIYMSSAVYQLWPLVNGNRGQSLNVTTLADTNLTGTIIQYLSVGDSFGITAYANYLTGLTIYENAAHTYFRGNLIG